MHVIAQTIKIPICFIDNKSLC